MKKAFTLAEIMIVLSVIAIITAILLPAARNATPNEKVMKFKKAYEMIQGAIAEFMNSDEYYLDGDLGKRINGEWIDGEHDGDFTYFCETLADVLGAKKKHCIDNNGIFAVYAYTYSLDNVHRLNDDMCKVVQNNNCGSSKFSRPSYFITKNNITIYEHNEKTTYGMVNPDSGVRSFQKACIDSCNYKPLCVDIDGVCKGEDPFTFAISAKGKIIISQRAQEWLNKSIHEKD